MASRKARKTRGQFLKYLSGRKIVRIPPGGLFIHLRRP